eukprot:NODE_1034_length_1043_cov_85.501092_g990_i0.p1 GENE.NODE_1034_length_1043_cov_85.501092_g990_i0~~NODE_1034_length_1043_cov_85.501092_g990_i0.p1  ORF type:complete len:284 (-),score=52.48 NODE_1034_length_1043_cov_85.501092_g990_i0:53-904(-)
MSAFLVRIDFFAKNAAAAEAVMEVFKTSSEHQINNHGGVIIYHFARPNEKKPNLIEITQVYNTEKVHFDHTKDKNIQAKMTNEFNSDKNKQRSDQYAYGQLPDKVKHFMDTLSYKYPPTECGFVINKKGNFTASVNPVFIKVLINAKRPAAKNELSNASANVEQVMKSLRKIAEIHSSSSAAVFHISRNEPQTHPHMIEILAVYPSNPKMINHLGDPTVRDEFKRTMPTCSKVITYVYGQVEDEGKKVLTELKLDPLYKNGDRIRAPPQGNVGLKYVNGDNFF